MDVGTPKAVVASGDVGMTRCFVRYVDINFAIPSGGKGFMPNEDTLKPDEDTTSTYGGSAVGETHTTQTKQVNSSLGKSLQRHKTPQRVTSVRKEHLRWASHCSATGHHNV